MHVPNINVHMLITALGWAVSQAIAWGVLNTGLAQTIIAIGGIVIPGVYGIAQALHLGRVHAAKIGEASSASLAATMAKVANPPEK